MDYIPAKRIVAKAQGGDWFGIDYNMNIYRGCSHGCIYCDSRSDCFQVEDFDRVRAKQDALRIVRDDLLKKRKRGVVGTGAMSDPYNPLEREHKLTRNTLELLNAYRFGVSIATKSNLVARDIPVLRDIQAHSPVIVKVTITASDDDLCKIVEPNAPLSSERFATIKALSDSGIYAGVLMVPLLPFIEDTDENIIGIARKAKESGARFVYTYMGMTLRAGSREYYYQKLDEHFPGLKERYIEKYKERYNCAVPRARSRWNVFASECQRLGLRYEMRDIIIDYKRGYTAKQFDLFDPADL